MRTHPRRRRDRLAVLWLILGITLGHLGISATVETGPVRLRDPEYAAKRDRLEAWLARHPGEGWTLALGSSRTAQGLAPRLVVPGCVAYNFAVAGCGPMLQRVLYERLHAEGFRPARVLIEVMPVFFNGPAGDSAQMRLLDTARLNAGELGAVADASTHLYAKYRRWAFARAVPEWRHARELREEVGLDVYQPGTAPEEPEAAIEADGWQPVRTAYYREQADALHRLAHKQYDRFYPRFTPSAAVGQLGRLIERVRADGGEAILVVMPEASHFRALASEQHRAGFDALLGQLRQAHRVRCIDAREWVPDAEFFDGHHLYPEGGERFSRRLGETLRASEALPAAPPGSGGGD